MERRKKAAIELSKAKGWASALGGLLPDDAITSTAPKLKLTGGDPEQLKAAAYKLAVNDHVGARLALDYLTAAEAEERYLTAIREAADSCGADASGFVALRTAIATLISSQADLNGPGLMVLAKLAVLSDEGKEFLRTGDKGPAPVPVAKPLDDFIASHFKDTDDATKASKEAYKALANAIHSPVSTAKSKELDKKPAPLTDAQLKVAEGLIGQIKDVFKGVKPLGVTADAKATAANKGSPQQMKQLQGLITGAEQPIREWVYAWREKDGPNKGKGVLELLGGYLSPTQVEELNAILDPVEQLFKDLVDLRNGRRDPKLPKVTEYQLLHDFLAAHSADAATRKRVQNDARIMEPFLYFQGAEKSKILIRMIVTGREDPDAIDKVHDAADKGDSNAAIQAIFELGGKEPAKLQELRKDLLFVHRLKDKCGARVKYNGVETTAYELFLRMCGVDPHDTKEAGAIDKQSEANPDHLEPATPEDLANLEQKLYTPWAKPIADQLTSFWTRDSKVMSALRSFQTAAAEPDNVKLLRKAKQAPGPTLANRIQALGCDVRLKCQRGLSDENLHEAERILGFVADQASTGVIGGQGALATDNTPKSDTKIGLEQALRETTVAGGVLTQVIHDAAKAMADELTRWLGARHEHVSSIWNDYHGKVNEQVCADLRDKTGLPRVWAIELLQNAYLPIGGGSLESKLKSELGKEHNDVITAMGMSPTDVAARRTLAEQNVTLDNKNEKANTDKLAAATAEVHQAEQVEQFRSPAKELFDGLATITRSADEGTLRGLGSKLHADLRIAAVAQAPANVIAGPRPAPTAENDVSARAGGPVHPGQGTPTDFASFYKREYGIDPQRHAVDVAKALASRERTAQQIGELLGVIDPSLFVPPAAPSNEKVVVDKTNITLVSPDFTETTANDHAKKIWDLIHTNGQVQLIRQEFGATQEEDRLINIAFRQLSGGVDIQFFLQQHLAQEKKWSDQQQQAANAVSVGGGGTNDADTRSLHVIGGAAETEAAAERAATGKISIEKQLSTLITANNMDEVYRIVGTATEQERRAILANSELMTQLRKFGDDSYEWNRIYKTLTGQADLFDKLESRAHGKHGIIGGMFEGTDEKGMTADIKDHAKQRKVEIRAQVVKEIFEGKEPQDKEGREKLDKEVIRRLKVEFQSDLENPSIRALLTDELSGAELSKTEGQLMNAGEENKLASVLTEGDWTEDEEKILDDIKKMTPAERKKARENPEYIAQLRKAIQTQGTWRDAMILLESNSDGSKEGGDDNYAKLERASRSTRQDTTELMFEQDDVIEALSKLTPDEYARLKANPRLQAQVLTSLEGHPDQLAKARQMMAFNVNDAGATTGLQIAKDGEPPDPKKGVYGRGAVERLAFMKFSAENQITVGASRGWGVLLQGAIAVYNMKLKPSDAEKEAKGDGGGEDDAKPLTKADVQKQDSGPGSNGTATKPATNGALTATPAAPQKDAKKEEAPPDPKSGEAAVEERLRKEILTDTQQAFKDATNGWGAQKSDGDDKKQRTMVDAAKQQSIIEGAILHTHDPSDSLLMASTGFWGDDEDRIKETLRKASDDQLIREWSNCIHHAPNGSKSLKEKYTEWLVARGASGRGVEPEAHVPGAAAAPQAGEKPDAKKPKKQPYAVGSPEWKARTAFKTHIVDTSDVFEDLLLKYTGGVMADDEKMAPGSKRVRDNSEWLEWRTIIRDRLPNLDREKIGTEIGAGNDHEAMDVLRDPNAKVLSDTLSQLDYDQERYLVDRGAESNYNMDRLTAGGEGLALDNSMDAYKQQVMGSVIAKGPDAADKYGDIDAGEQAKIAEAKSRFQANDQAFRDAKSQVATIASTVVALIITAVVTILTAGTATGPLATILIAAITAGAASAGTQVTKEAIQGTDFDLGKDGLENIARDTIMGAITAGTTWYAGKIVNGLFSAGSAAEQAAIIARTAANPNFLASMGRAMAENSLQTGMQGLFESGAAAFDPAMWLDGWNEGWRRGSSAARERAQEIPLEMLRAAVIAAMSHSANAGINKLKGGGGAEEGGWHGQHSKLGNRMDVGDRTALTLKTMGHGAREGVIMGGAEILLDEKTYRAEGQKPGDMLGHVVQSSASMAQMSPMGMHQGDSSALMEMHENDAAGQSRAKAAQRELAQHGSELTPHEQAQYNELCTKHGGTDTTVLSVAEFKQARGEMVDKSVAKFEAETERKLTSEERTAFEKYVASAPTLEAYVSRAEAGPNGAPGVKHTDVMPKLDKPAAREKARARASEVLEQLTTAAEGSKGKTESLGDVRAQQVQTMAEAKRLIDEIQRGAKTAADHQAVLELVSRVNAIAGELGRALDTVAGVAAIEGLRSELQNALDIAQKSPADVNAHKALHQLVVEGAVATATSPAEVAHAAEVAPKKLAELKAMLEELAHARDNAARRALNDTTTTTGTVADVKVDTPAKDDPVKKDPTKKDAKTEDDPTKKDPVAKDETHKDDVTKDETTKKADPTKTDPQVAKFDEAKKADAIKRMEPLTDAEKQQFDRLFKTHGMPEAESLMGEWRKLHATAMPSIDDQMGKQDQKDHHAQVEVHNHITGVVEPEQFRDQLKAASALDPKLAAEMKPGESEWMPMIRELMKLQGQHVPETDKNGHVEIDPDTGKPKVKLRGVAGDAHQELKEAVADITKLETKRAELVEAQNSGADNAQLIAKLTEQINQRAKLAVDEALRASEHTDFNSAYELRDELLKKFYGNAERNEMLVEAKVDPKSDFSNPALVEAYRSHFDGRPRVQAAIEEAVKAQQELKDNQSLTKDRRAELEKKVNAVPEQMAYDRFLMDTLTQLAKDGLRYSEQSVSANKMDARFDPEQLAWVKAKLEAELIKNGDKETAQRVRDLEVKYVAMLNTSSFGGHDENVVETDIKKPGDKTEGGATRYSNKETSDAKFEGQIDQVVRQATRPDSVGVDIAGMEHMVFDETGRDRFKQLYEALLKAAKLNGQTLVLRPHVGEGATDVEPGKHFHGKMDRQTVKDENKLTHQDRAERNVEALLQTCELIAAAHGGKLPPEVIVRFGHATHATPDQVERMTKLGIIAEVNLRSNVETGAEPQTTHDLSKGDKHLGKDPVPEVTEDKLDEHSLASFVYNGATVILSTDGHSVMSTGLGQEYAAAKKVIDKVIDGSAPVMITAEQAMRERAAGGTVAHPGGAEAVPIFFKEMSPESQKRFLDAERKLFEDARKYFDTRPKQTEGKSPPDDSAFKKAEDQQQALAAAKHEGELRDEGKEPTEKQKMTKDQRTVLADELSRQIPDIKLMAAVQEGTANSIVSLVFPGSSGDFGIKRMNDDVLGMQLNNELMTKRDKISHDVLVAHGLTVVDQTYKSTTVVSSKSPAELAATLKLAMTEIDAKMREACAEMLEKGRKHWQGEAEKLRARHKGDEAALQKDADYQNVEKRLHNITELAGKVGPDKPFEFDMQLGVSEVKGGKDATYGEVLAAEMNANKAAIMSRDGTLDRGDGAQIGDHRAHIFDDAGFKQFAEQTMADRKDLVGKTIPFHGKQVPVMTESGINIDVLRELRKGKIVPPKEPNAEWSEAQIKTLQDLGLYFTRVNTLDYYKAFTTNEMETQGNRVQEAKELIAHLKGDQPISKEMADHIRELLAGRTTQSRTASEAEFYNRAAQLGDRVLLNADVKDMGLDVFLDNEAKMKDVAKGKDVHDASNKAGDKVTKQKRKIEEQFRRFYERELLPKAIERAYQLGRVDLAEALAAEKEPLILIGGDELTVSLHPAFEELGMTNLAVKKLTDPEVGNARVAVTHTDPDLGGDFGHLVAMGDSENAHKMLKGLEGRSRDLRDASRDRGNGMNNPQRAAARELADEIERMYTTDKDGRTVLLDSKGKVRNVDELEAQIQALLDDKNKPSNDNE